MFSNIVPVIPCLRVVACDTLAALALEDGNGGPIAAAGGVAAMRRLAGDDIEIVKKHDTSGAAQHCGPNPLPRGLGKKTDEKWVRQRGKGLVERLFTHTSAIWSSARRGLPKSKNGVKIGEKGQNKTEPRGYSPFFFSEFFLRILLLSGR